MSPTNSGAAATDIRRAARLIREGGLVAFPTETVYGLGANAWDEAAVARIFEVKGRPVSSPLIVHVAAAESARELVLEWPDSAEKLARRFWPGPLTLVLRKQPRVPDLVTAGLPTVGVRVPRHPVALALIREAGVPIAAPSANLFTELSPTAPGHLRQRLLDQVDATLDGGATPIGIESTVVSLAGEPPVLLRPGMISRADLEALIGPVGEAKFPGESHPAPGMHHRHYAPRTKLVIVAGDALPETGRGVYLWLQHPQAAAKQVPMPGDAAAYATRLYGLLHELDREGWDWIAVEAPPDSAEWDGIRDRLRRAAG